MKFGFTIVELLVTMLITTIVVVVFGLGVVRLLKLEESNRQEGYIRERLTMITSTYADYLSMGSGLWPVDLPDNVKGYCTEFRTETGGVSFETGKVTRVVGMTSSVSNGFFNIGINTAGEISNVLLEKHISGAAELLPVLSLITDISIYPDDGPVRMLSITASNTVFNVKSNQYEPRQIVSKRLFRLWNRN